MTVQAGELDRRVTILDYSFDDVDEFGSPISTYMPVGTVWANRADISDSERYAGYGIVASIISRFIVRSSDLDRTGAGPFMGGFLRRSKPDQPLCGQPLDGPLHVVVPALDHDGKEWNITGIKEAKFGRHQFLEITATAEL